MDHNSIKNFIEFSSQNDGRTFILNPQFQHEFIEFVIAINEDCAEKDIPKYPLDLLLQIFISKKF